MTAVDVDAGAAPATPHGRPANYATRPSFAVPSSNGAMLAFAAISLLATMAVDQVIVLTPDFAAYWLLILPAMFFPFFNTPGMLRTATSWPAVLLVATLIAAGGWHAVSGDMRAATRLALFVLILLWASTSEARFRDRDLVLLYVGLLIVGVAVALFTPLNKWGLLPGLTAGTHGPWRISFTPNIAYSAFISLFIIMVVTRNALSFRRYWLILPVALMFVGLSFVRTALIALVAYLICVWFWRKIRSPAFLFWGAITVAAGINLSIVVSPYLLEQLQQVPYFARFFLKGKADLGGIDIYVQLYRPYVWSQHLIFFANSPFLMGWGVFDFNEMRTIALIGGRGWSDAIAMPTRMLASYGLPMLFLLAFSLVHLWRRACERDVWACACFPVLILVAMQWGSILHPANPMFLLFFMTLIKGSGGFVARPVRRNAEPARGQSTSRS